MSHPWEERAITLAIVASAIGLYEVSRARAQNIPAMPTMFYGVSLDENGAPVTGTRDLRVRFFDGEMGGTQLCETLANGTTVTQGRARIALSETCRTAVQQNASVWVELAVGGSVVGTRSRIGAVPYSVEAARANALTAAAEASNVNRACPPEYARDDGQSTSTVTVCVRTIAGGRDEVVKVGTGASAFWIDRYEARVFDSGGTQYGATDAPYPNLARNGQWSMGSRNSLLALSRAGGRPSAWVTWFQANALCRAAGKRLPTGDEWFIAADDLVRQDPATALNGNVSGVTGCNTGGTGARSTGGGTGCVSSWGAQDMIGNVGEWTAEWYAGIGNGMGTNDLTWPPASNLYPGDGTWNIVSSAFSGSSGSDGVRSGVPSAALRGGSWPNQGRAGVFALNLNVAPSLWEEGVGFRCVLQR